MDSVLLFYFYVCFFVNLFVLCEAEVNTVYLFIFKW